MPGHIHKLDRPGDDPLQVELQTWHDASLLSKEDGWAVQEFSQPPCTWMSVRNCYHSLPEQGYKLHVSASTKNAPAVLHKVLSVLVPIKASFKFAASLADLRFFSSGKAGLTQVGKFMTIYPHDDRVAVQIAEAIDQSTRGMRGPIIPFENSIAEASLVHYRYGAFTPALLQLDNGEVTPALRGEDGILIPDVRTTASFPGRTDPFREAGFTPISPGIRPFTSRDRYFRRDVLHQSPRGSSWLGIDTASPNRDLVVVKEAREGALETLDGCDAVSRLCRESEFIQRLSPSSFFPFFVDHWTEDRRAFLVYRFIEGIPLNRLLLNLGSAGVSLDERTLCSWSLALCDALDCLHSQGLVFGDLKPANVILSAEGRLSLIDLELCEASEAAEPHSLGFGTLGYASHAQMDRRSRSKADDIFALGATIFSLATNIDLSMFSPGIRHDEVMRLVRPELSTGLSDTILDCLKSSVDNQPIISLSHVYSRLKESTGTLAPNVACVPATNSTLDKAKYLSFARGIGDSLCNQAVVQDNSAHWVSSHPVAKQVATRGIYVGVSGIGLFLCDLYKATLDEKYLHVAEQAARWLQQGKGRVGRETPLPGLYFGEAGVGLFQLKLYQVTHNPTYLDRALSVSAQLQTLACRAPDLLSGSAGLGLFHLLAFLVSRHEECLARAIQMGNRLLKEQSDTSSLWRIPEGFETLSGKEYLGFAHGAAGIAYFLSELYSATGASFYAEAVQRVVEKLSIEALTTLSDGSGFNWPPEPGGKLGSLHWCHGAPGIVRFLLRVRQLLPQVDVQAMTVSALDTVIHGSSCVGTTQCHGLAGNLEVLIDAHQGLANPSYLGEAEKLASLLSHHRSCDRFGVRWHSEQPSVFTPDFMVGESGIGSSLCRLANPAFAHHALSCAAIV